MSPQSSTGKGIRNRPFKLNIIFVFGLILIPTVITIAAFTYYKNSRAALEMANTLVEKITRAVIEKTTNFMEPAQIFADISAALVKDSNIDLGPDSILEDYFIRIVRAQRQIGMIYFGTEDGDFYQVSWLEKDKPLYIKHIDRQNGAVSMSIRYLNEDLKQVDVEKTTDVKYDHRIRSWYKITKASMGPTWTDVYIFFASGQPGITASYPIMTKAGGLYGVMAADISLRGLSEFLKSTNISENGLVFILDDKKQFVAFPDPNRGVRVKDGKIVPVHVTEIGEKRITDAVRVFEDTGLAQFSYKSGGKKSLAFFTPFPPSFGKAWNIVVLVPEDDFLGPIKRTAVISLIISGLILLAAVGLGLWFARNLSRPIELLTQEVQKIREFDLDRRTPISSYISEIQMMSDAVEAMKSGLMAFRRYVPAALVRQLIQTGDEAKPGGTERELTLFFSDITGFTPISEQISARELMVNISEYLDAVSKVIASERGTVDKYIGDAVMAFWGAPLPDEDHAFHACRAALRCQSTIADLNTRWAEEKKFAFDTRIGLHSGFTIVGNMGSDERLNYSVLGDSVNLASRLEGVNKRYGTSIIISQTTYRYVRNSFILRPLDIVAVKGKRSGVKIYELMGDDESENSDALRSLAEGFENCFDLYLNRSWREALEALEELKTRFPEDEPTALYLKRCRSYIENDPGPDWSGIIRLDSE